MFQAFWRGVHRSPLPAKNTTHLLWLSCRALTVPISVREASAQQSSQEPPPACQPIRVGFTNRPQLWSSRSYAYRVSKLPLDVPGGSESDDEGSLAEAADTNSVDSGGEADQPRKTNETVWADFPRGQTGKVVEDDCHPITDADLPAPVWFVLLELREAGHDVYLVGGAVRDLLLGNTPKDFDLLTTAQPQQTKKLFGRAFVVGARFPICLVHHGGMVMEVSSFHTNTPREHVPIDAASRRQTLFRSQRRGRTQASLPEGASLKEARSYNAMRRDFTVNGLLYEPFQRIIYDYVNGIEHCSRRRLKTIGWPKDSFEEDPARILRSIRVSARCGLQITRMLGEAISQQASDISQMNGSRTALELEKLMAYGASQKSLQLLWQYQLLDVILPHHASYLNLHHIPRDNWYETKESSVRSGLFQALGLLDQHVLAAEPFSPAHAALWISALAAPLLHYSMQYPQAKLPWQSRNADDASTDSDIEEDPETSSHPDDSDEDTFTKEDLFGEPSPEAMKASIPDNLEDSPIPESSDPSAKLRAMATDLLDNLMRPAAGQGNSSKAGDGSRKGRRGRSSRSPSQTSVLPRAHFDRVLSLLMRGSQIIVSLDRQEGEGSHGLKGRGREQQQESVLLITSIFKKLRST